jgi:hypothetical protein
MIKIEIPKIDEVKRDYLGLLRDPVKERIKPLIISLHHLNGATIDVTQGNFERYKHITRKIVDKYINGTKLEIYLFNLANYKSTVQDFVLNTSKKSDYSNVNLNGLINFLESLIIPNTNELDKLLICHAANLKTLQDDLLNNHSITGDDNKFVLAKAFNYEKFDQDISTLIRDFFRSQNFINFCPYCNLNEVLFIEAEDGNPAAAHQLDHFFDKATFPLLSYSLFNLVPSDSTCNTTNKGTIEFSDDYHLNPYLNGFGKKMIFKPRRAGFKVHEIELSVTASKTDPFFLQLLGVDTDINESSKRGNINVFKLKSKYRSRIEEANDILETIYRAQKGKRSNDYFLDEIQILNKEEHYRKWYKRNFKTHFDFKDFHKKAYSKFNRDIHDYYFINDGNNSNDFIRLMINE